MKPSFVLTPISALATVAASPLNAAPLASAEQTDYKAAEQHEARDVRTGTTGRTVCVDATAARLVCAEQAPRECAGAIQRDPAVARR